MCFFLSCFCPHTVPLPFIVPWTLFLRNSFPEHCQPVLAINWEGKEKETKKCNPQLGGSKLERWSINNRAIFRAYKLDLPASTRHGLVNLAQAESTPCAFFSLFPHCRILLEKILFFVASSMDRVCTGRKQNRTAHNRTSGHPLGSSIVSSARLKSWMSQPSGRTSIGTASGTVAPKQNVQLSAADRWRADGCICLCLCTHGDGLKTKKGLSSTLSGLSDNCPRVVAEIRSFFYLSHSKPRSFDFRTPTGMGIDGAINCTSLLRDSGHKVKDQKTNDQTTLILSCRQAELKDDPGVSNRWALYHNKSKARWQRYHCQLLDSECVLKMSN